MQQEMRQHGGVITWATSSCARYFRHALRSAKDFGTPIVLLTCQSVVKLTHLRVIATRAAGNYIMSGATMSTRRCFWKQASSVVWQTG
jgi:hypothetical protein